MVCGATNLRQYSTVTTPRRGVSTGRSAKNLPSMPSASASRLRLAGPRGPAADGELGLDQIDEVGVDSVLQGRSDALTRSMREESRETCSALATSLLQALGPFNYVSQRNFSWCMQRLNLVGDFSETSHKIMTMRCNAFCPCV